LIRSSKPFLLERYHRIVDDAAAFEVFLKRPLPRCIWTHPLRTRPEKLARRLEEDGYRLTPLTGFPGAFRVASEPRPLGGHWTYQAGLFHIQEAASMVPVRLLSPRPGMRIMDLCAAPGNKTVQAAAAMENRGTVVANDLRYHRMASIRMHIDRLGMVNVSTTCSDGGSYPRKAGLFDAVLVDVPCSCEGTSRKNPDILQRPVPGRERLLLRQKWLLERAVRLCRPGGRIVYSTCTYDPEENEGVLDAVLRTMPDRLEMRPASIPGLRADPGLTAWGPKRYLPDLHMAMRLWPHLNDSGGFFAAVLKRTGDLFSEPEPSPPICEAENGQAAESENRLFPNPGRVHALLASRFGIAPSAFDGFCLLERGRRQIFLVAADHRPPRHPQPAAGLPLLHLSMKTPKLTTAGALLMGAHARRNVIDVDGEQRDRYLHRRRFALHSAQLPDPASDGHVLIRHRGVLLGVGVFRSASMTVESLYPKRFAAAAADSLRG